MPDSKSRDLQNRIDKALSNIEGWSEDIHPYDEFMSNTERDRRQAIENVVWWLHDFECTCIVCKGTKQ